MSAAVPVETRQLRDCESLRFVRVDGVDEVWLVDETLWAVGNYDVGSALAEWCDSIGDEIKDGPIIARFFSSAQKVPHCCRAVLAKDDSGQYGEASSRCYQREDGSLWIENGEYESRVNFCPYCGFRSTGQLAASEQVGT